MGESSKTHRVLIVGDSLFAESLAQILSTTGEVEVTGTAATPEEALACIDEIPPDVVIGAGSVDVSQALIGPLLSLFPDLPIICADLESDQVQLITSRPIGSRSVDLLTAIQQLTRRS